MRRSPRKPHEQLGRIPAPADDDDTVVFCCCIVLAVAVAVVLDTREDVLDAGAILEEAAVCVGVEVESALFLSLPILKEVRPRERRLGSMTDQSPRGSRRELLLLLC